MRKILHIGLGKTGTTTFQHYVLPNLIKARILAIPEQNSFRKLKLLELATYSNQVKPPHISWPRDAKACLLSYEGLVGYPNRWNHNFEVLASTLDRDVEILISFREPNNWLKSNYLQAVAMGLVMEPSEFFANSKSCSAQRDKSREIPKVFSPDLVNYRSLINLYSQHFQTVRAVSMNTLISQEAFCEALELEKPIESIIPTQHVGRLNVSYSKQAIALTQWREFLLNRIGLRSLSFIDELEKTIDEVIASQSLEVQTRQNAKLDSSSINYYMYRILRRMSRCKRFVEWRWMMQSVLPLIYPTTPYDITLGLEQQHTALVESHNFARMLNSRGSITNHELENYSSS